MSQPGNHPGTDKEIMYLKGDLRFRCVWERVIDYNAALVAIEVDFKGNKPDRPIFVKFESGEDKRKSPRFKKAEPVNWDLGNNLRLLLPTDLAISVEEVDIINRKKNIATFKVNLTSADVAGRDKLSVDDTSGRASVKLTFVSLQNEKIAERLISEAQTAVGNKKVVLDSLGKAGKAIAVLMKFTDLASEVHPAAKSAFSVVGVLYKQFQAQQECHDMATALMDDVASFLPFVGDDIQTKNARTRETIVEMLDLFCKVSRLVIEYSGKGMLGDLFSSRKDELELSMGELRRLRKTYDWCIMTEIWITAIETGMRAEDIQLQQLCPAKRAFYDIGKGCLEGTRISVLEQIRDWGASNTGSGLFWLHGVAGSGKSAIANSVARMFEGQQSLLGCFFCKKDDPECRVPMNVIPTLAMHFSKWHQMYRSMVASVIQGRDGPKLTQSLQWQFELLFKVPLNSLSATSAVLPPRPLIIVIDALDECGDLADSRSELARFLVKMASLEAVPWLKVFVTSRTMPELQGVFQEGALCQTFNLNTEVNNEQVQDDMLRYTRHCATKFSLTEAEIKQLSTMAAGLFIWTSTVFNFINDHKMKHRALREILSLKGGQKTVLDQLYTKVIQSAIEKEDEAYIVKAILSVIVSTAKNTPLPEDTLMH
ncbi:hypothetical protein M0805_006446, partial [Coniferiporia weirii]